MLSRICPARAHTLSRIEARDHRIELLAAEEKLLLLGRFDAFDYGLIGTMRGKSGECLRERELDLEVCTC